MKELHVEEQSSSFRKKSVIIIVVGMAGSGKTVFLKKQVSHSAASNIGGYVLNLDPAVLTLPYAANVDIRDTVRYKEVMSQFNLGPSGGILTSLNLFSTKFDEHQMHEFGNGTLKYSWWLIAGDIYDQETSRSAPLCSGLKDLRLDDKSMENDEDEEEEDEESCSDQFEDDDMDAVDEDEDDD